MLKDLALYNNFRRLLRIKDDTNSKVKNMDDVELVLRFFAFGKNENYKNYRDGKLERFLSDYMDKTNKLVKNNKNLLKIFKSDFYRVMDFIYQNFGDIAFTKFNKDSKQKQFFNKTVFDALAVSIYIDVDTRNAKITKEFKEECNNLFSKNSKFKGLFDGSVVTASKVKTRIEIVRGLLRKHNISF